MLKTGDYVDVIFPGQGKRDEGRIKGIKGDPKMAKTLIYIKSIKDNNPHWTRCYQAFMVTKSTKDNSLLSETPKLRGEKQ